MYTKQGNYPAHIILGLGQAFAAGAVVPIPTVPADQISGIPSDQISGVCWLLTLEYEIPGEKLHDLNIIFYILFF